MQAMILAAGLGTRMHPHTYIRPKPLLPLANVPLLSYHLGWLKHQGGRTIAINLHYLPHLIPSVIGQGDNFGLTIKYSWEPVILGTGGGIKQMAKLLSRRSTLVVINSDMLTNVDLTPALELHHKRGALATLLLTRSASVDKFGGVGLDSQGRVRQIANRIPDAPSDLTQGVFAGIHLIEPELLKYIPEGEVCINAQVYPKLIQPDSHIYGYFIPEPFFWRHLGSPAEYLKVSEELLARRLPLPISLAEINPGIWVEYPVLIEPNVQLVPPVVVGRYCRIASGAKIGPYVTLGRGCNIASGCRIEQSVIWDGIDFDPNANVGHAIMSHSSLCL